MKSWLTTRELGERLAKRDPRVAALNAKRRNEYALRLVRRAERYDSVRCTKRYGKRVLVNVRILEELLPSDAATVDRIDVELGRLSQDHRHLKGRVNGHAQKIKTHDIAIAFLKEELAVEQDRAAKLADINRRRIAAQMPHP